jgi:tetratricopeptide (TPR) repeat protein
VSPFADFLVRALNLLVLALAPPFCSPAPAEGHGLLPGVAAGVVLAALLFAAGTLRVRLGGRAGLAAAVLIGAAVAAALIGADVFRAERGPLGRGVLYVAVPLWAGLAVVVVDVVGRRWGAHAPGDLRRARAVAGALVAGAFVVLFAPCGRWLLSPEGMWLEALRYDGDDAAAVEALTRAPLRAKRYEAALTVMDRCLGVSPGACACLARRAEVGLRTLASPQAIDGARAALDRCPQSIAARATLAEALALFGDAEQGEQEARAGLEKAEDARLRYALGLALQRAGRLPEALDEARRALKLGGGRDAALLVGSLAITVGDLDTAVEALRPVVAADPGDAEAVYDLALVAHKRGDYNGARQGYLAALRANPRLAEARYNLVDLTLSRGAVDEARHHLERFVATFPDDARGAVLARRIAAAPRP